MSGLTITDRACGGIKAKKLLDAVRAGTSARINATGGIYFSKHPTRGREWRAWPAAFLVGFIELPAIEFRQRAAEFYGIDPARVHELGDREIDDVAQVILAGGRPCTAQ